MKKIKIASSYTSLLKSDLDGYIALQPFFGYEWYKDGILQYTLRNYVLFNSDSFPD